MSSPQIWLLRARGPEVHPNPPTDISAPPRAVSMKGFRDRPKFTRNFIEDILPFGNIFSLDHVDSPAREGHRIIILFVDAKSAAACIKHYSEYRLIYAGRRIEVAAPTDVVLHADVEPVVWGKNMSRTIKITSAVETTDPNWFSYSIKTDKVVEALSSRASKPAVIFQFTSISYALDVMLALSDSKANYNLEWEDDDTPEAPIIPERSQPRTLLTRPVEPQKPQW